MKQKVWVIDDDDWGLPAGKQATPAASQTGRNPEPRLLAKEIGGEAHREPSQKNPALSFSLSLLVWGAGHMYLRQYRLGSIYMVSMALFYTVFAALVLFWESVSGPSADVIEEMPLLIMAAMVAFMVGLACWAVNAVDAYYRALQLTDNPYLGVDNELCPLLSSLLFPGWGQFLNAQPGRGVFFLMLWMLGIFSIFLLSVAWYVWPFLIVSPVSYLFEICIISALLYLPWAVCIWVVAVYDAFVVCYRGGEYALAPRSSAIIGLLLAISVGMQAVPDGYYLEFLEQARFEMLNSNMKIIPELVRKACMLISR